MSTHQPITNRFTRLSEADVRADAAFEKHRDGGGPFLHELHPSAQRCIYELTERVAKLEQLHAAQHEQHESGNERQPNDEPSRRGEP